MLIPCFQRCKMTSLLASSILEPLRRQVAKPRLALQRLAEEINCSENRAFFYMISKHCLPFFHYHPQRGIVYHVTWKHHVLYTPVYLRTTQYVIFAIFFCNWHDFGGIQIYRQCFAIFFSTFVILNFVTLYTILWRRQEIETLFKLTTEYDSKFNRLTTSIGSDSSSFSNPSKQGVGRIKMFVFFACFMILSTPVQTLITIVDYKTAFSPFESQMGKDNPNRGWWIFAEAVFAWPTLVLVELSLTQLAVPWLLFSFGFKLSLTRIKTLLSDRKLSFFKLDLLLNHYVDLWRIMGVMNEVKNPLLVAAWRTSIVASLVPSNLLLYRWYIGSSEVRDVNPLVIAFLSVMWIFMLIFGLWTFNYMSSFRIESNEIMKAMKYYCLQRLIESDCDPGICCQVAYLRRRIGSLREICVESKTFGKISSMADIRILEELTDYTTSGLLTTR